MHTRELNLAREVTHLLLIIGRSLGSFLFRHFLLLAHSEVYRYLVLGRSNSYL